MKSQKVRYPGCIIVYPALKTHCQSSLYLYLVNLFALACAGFHANGVLRGAE